MLTIIKAIVKVIDEPANRGWKLLMITAVGMLLPAELFPAQSADTTRTAVERDIERAVQELDPEDESGTITELAEFLEELAANPVNVNRATADELLIIPGLGFRQAQAIVQYRSEHGAFNRIDVLLNVPGIGNVTLERILPYITIGEPETDRAGFSDRWRQFTGNGRFETFSRYRTVLEPQQGYQRPDTLGGYLGSPVNYYQRFRYSSRHLSMNLTQNKQPGEPLNGINGFGFTSWHMSAQNLGPVRTIVVGDYSVAFGQGLLLWTGGAFGKGSNVIGTARKNERGIRPYTSARQPDAFRGAAATVGNRLQVTGFYSNRRRTATEADYGFVRFPTRTGVHRTLNEMGRKDNLGQETFGGRIRWQWSGGFAGVSAMHNRFSRPVQRGTQPYQLYNFEGSTVTGYSADYRFIAGPVLLFGEAVYTVGGTAAGSGTNGEAYGVISGIEMDAGQSTTAVMAFRRYDARLQSLFGAGFGEQSGTPRNEEGFYIGIRHRLSSKILLNIYADRFRFHAPRFQTRQPTSGYDWLILTEYRPVRTLTLMAQIRYRERDQEYISADPFGRELRLLGYHKRTSVRLQGEFQPTRDIRLRTRVEFVRSRTTPDEPAVGMLVFQDVRFNPVSRLRVDARITLFDTAGYEARLFQFENDLLYVMTNTMLFDRGQRMYAAIHYRAADWFDIWMKAGTTLYENRNIIGSGNNQIHGNRRSDVGVQVRVRV